MTAASAARTLPMGRRHATVVHMLADAAAANPNGEAVVFADRRITYADFLAHTLAIRDQLVTFGVAGGRVATVLPNSPAACFVHFAILAAGAVHVPLNPLYTARELEEILADCRPALLIADGALRERIEPAAPSLAALWVDPASWPPPAERGGGTSDGLCDRVDPDAIALLQYTGGTSGRPKGVMLSHRSVATNVAQREGALPTRAGEERILCVMPLFHSYAMTMGLYLAVNARSTLVLLPQYRPDPVFDLLQAERITLFPGSPTLFQGLMAHERFRTTDWSALRLCYSGSAALPKETLERWDAAVGAPIYEGYGQTEAGPILTYNSPLLPAKPAAVGLAVAETMVEIVDLEAGTRVLGPGERGEIRARGPQIMRAYLNRPEETAQALRDGWLYTGDIGEIDGDGYLFVRDRKKDMIIVGGYNVYPREVEEVLFTSPAVRDVAVIGVPDAYKGEAIVAFVQASAPTDADQLRAFCAERLARYKIPAVFSFVDALPKTSVNKTDKKRLASLDVAGQSAGPAA